jgi:hypothetical protein
LNLDFDIFSHEILIGPPVSLCTALLADQVRQLVAVTGSERARHTRRGVIDFGGRERQSSGGIGEGLSHNHALRKQALERFRDAHESLLVEELGYEARVE